MTTQDERERREQRARSLDGTIIAAVGPSGCGKTDRAIRVSLALAWANNMEWYGYDSNGDVQVHLRGIIQHHREAFRAATTPRERSRQQSKLLFLAKCLGHIFAGPVNLPKMLALMNQMVAEGQAMSKAGTLKKARAVFFVDEAGAVRDQDEDFWPNMRQGRNAGVTIVTTGHRPKDWHPAARANIRLAMVWKPKQDKWYEFNGMRIPRDVCGEPKSHIVKYFVGDDPTPWSWDTEKYPDAYPLEMLIPAQPTVARKAGF